MHLRTIIFCIGIIFVVAFITAEAAVPSNFNRFSAPGSTNSVSQRRPSVGQNRRITTRNPNNYGPTSRYRQQKPTIKPFKSAGPSRKYPHHYDMPTRRTVG